MANRLGNPLNKLIKKRAYTSGELAKAEAQEAELHKALQDTRVRIKSLSVTLADLDLEIRNRSAIDPTDIKAIRASVKHTELKRGSFRKQLVNILLASNGAISSIAIRTIIAETLSIPNQTQPERERLTQKVAYDLWHLHQKKVVERLPDAVGLNGIPHGMWRWIGPRPALEPQTESLPDA